MTKPDLTNTAPKRIYLDIGDQFALERVASGDLRWDLLEGVTWSEDNATSHGIPYVRADLVPTPAVSGAAPANMRESLKWCAAALQAIGKAWAEHESSRFELVDTKESKSLSEILDGADAALASREATEDGYTKAFYKIAAVLGIGARADTPESVFLKEMLPRITALASLEASLAPMPSVEATLRAMALNYTRGHSWDHLDKEACLRGADEIKRLIAALASPQVAPAPEEELPSMKKEVEAALIFALWHHQGGSSKVGQPIRKMLGIGQHMHLSAGQIEQAKRVQAAFDVANYGSATPVQVASTKRQPTEDDEMTLIESQIDGLLEGEGAGEDHANVKSWIAGAGLRESLVCRVHRAISCFERDHLSKPEAAPVAPQDDARDAALWREHVAKLDALVTYCPTCCQGYFASKEMTRDEIIFECGKTVGRSTPAAKPTEPTLPTQGERS